MSKYVKATPVLDNLLLKKNNKSFKLLKENIWRVLCCVCNKCVLWMSSKLGVDRLYLNRGHMQPKQSDCCRLSALTLFGKSNTLEHETFVVHRPSQLRITVNFYASNVTWIVQSPPDKSWNVHNIIKLNKWFVKFIYLTLGASERQNQSTP